MKKSSKNRLIIMAHPDDPELACGGTIAQWTECDNVHYIIISSGDKGTWQKDDSPNKTAYRREQEAKRGAKYLGVKKVIFLRHPDGDIASADTLKLELAALIRHIKPYTIVTHDPWRRQFHPDHRATAFAVINAIMIARDWHFYPFLHEIGLFPHRPQELFLTPTDKPTFINDISATIKKKIRAIKIHKSQLAQLPNWEERIKKHAEIDGKAAGYKYGEGFYKMHL
ncbi:PIG-L family deacetylase [candidate division WOR-3 bacterium]|jgi:LmbE family N-acetylglucosaminyl deacetylase|nr:PIG-L family deacetylase [candidate division WOR-3 bacterium]